MQIASLWKLESIGSYTEILWAQKFVLSSPCNWAIAENRWLWSRSKPKTGQAEYTKSHMARGNGHSSPFKVSGIDVFLKNHLNKLTSMFYFMKSGACRLWNGSPEMWHTHLNQLRVLFDSSSLNPIASHAQRTCRAPLWWFCPGLLAFVHQVLNFTNKAYWLMKNRTSISEATFQKEYFRLFTLRKALRRDEWLQSVFRILGFFF